MSFSTSRNHILTSYCAVLIGIAAVVVYFHTMSHEQAKAMLHENGVVEQLSAAGYLVCFMAILALGRWPFARAHFPLVAFPLVFWMRELDFDKRFTETGLLQSRVLTSPDVALLERVLGVAVMVGLVALVLMALRRYMVPLIKGLLRFDTVAVGVGLALGLMVISKSIDGLGRKLEPLGIFVTEQVTFEAILMEEVFELSIPLVLLIAVVAYFREARPVALSPRAAS